MVSNQENKKHLHVAFKQTIKWHFAGHFQHSWTPAPFMCMACQVSSFHWCDREADRNVDCFAFFPEGDERMAEWSGQADQGTRGGVVLESVLLTLHFHALSLIHCLPPSLFLSLSVSFPSSHILLSSSTYFLGDGGCRYMTRSSVWETQSKTGTDSPRCSDHSGGLHSSSSPLCCYSLCTSSLFCAPVEAPCTPTTAQLAWVTPTDNRQTHAYISLKTLDLFQWKSVAYFMQNTIQNCLG